MRRKTRNDRTRVDGLDRGQAFAWGPSRGAVVVGTSPAGVAWVVHPSRWRKDPGTFARLAERLDDMWARHLDRLARNAVAV